MRRADPGAKRGSWGPCARQCHGKGWLKAVWKRRTPATATCNRSTPVQPMERILAQILPSSNSYAVKDQLPGHATEPLTVSMRIMRAQKGSRPERKTMRVSHWPCMAPTTTCEVPSYEDVHCNSHFCSHLCVCRTPSVGRKHKTSCACTETNNPPTSKKTAAHCLAPPLTRGRAHFPSHAKLGVDLHRLRGRYRRCWRLQMGAQVARRARRRSRCRRASRRSRRRRRRGRCASRRRGPPRRRCRAHHCHGSQ